MKFLLYGANGHTAAFAIEYAKKQGIGHVEASPLTRSSHKAATAIRSLPSAS